MLPGIRSRNIYTFGSLKLIEFSARPANAAKRRKGRFATVTTNLIKVLWVATGCFADRLAKHVPLSDEERNALTRLEENPRKIKRGAMIQRVNDTVTELFVLREGRVMSFVILPDGSRQILRVYFPGDFIGSASTIYNKAPESLVGIVRLAGLVILTADDQHFVFSGCL